MNSDARADHERTPFTEKTSLLQHESRITPVGVIAIPPVTAVCDGQNQLAAVQGDVHRLRSIARADGTAVKDSSSGVVAHLERNQRGRTGADRVGQADNSLKLDGAFRNLEGHC